MSLTTVQDDDKDREEETPFLNNGDSDGPRKPTPLPTTQFLVLLTSWLAESIVDHSVSPYLNQLVRGLPIVEGDGRKVGYYTGIIVALEHAAEAMTAIHWNRLSDHVGRKPVLLLCLVGTIVSTMFFGFCRSFWALVLGRCMRGALKGSVGVVNSVVAELTDDTNVARGFSLLPTIWAMGFVIGPIIGGVLSRPRDRWPSVFSAPFWDNYPYFLPCLVSAAYACLSFVIVAIFFEETVRFRSASSDLDVIGEEPDDALDQDAQGPLPLRSVLTRPVLISIANYAMLALLGMISMTLIPLIWSTSIEFGGLNFNPASIGLWMSAYGCMNGILQFAVFPYAVRRFGPRWVVVTSVAMCSVSYLMFPFENFVLRRAAHGLAWLLVIMQLTAQSISHFGHGAMLMYLSSASPNKRSLGTTNGLAQSVASVQRAVGPAVADWLFAYSIANQVLGGNFVYVVLLVLVCVGLYVASQLPRQTWRHDEGYIPLT
ncbi:MFS general substrate transporter [Russula earlei]|uniref:MFS general substrate transporter n=1 Tax=Russula earlei TaxID=71964 RepID=A0ACC0U4K7_9AGAM|nr:MFS general substrate transporter [Russula earlei]